MNTELLNSILSFLDPHVSIFLISHSKANIDPSLFDKLMLNLLLRTKKYTETKELLQTLESSIPAATFTSLNEKLTLRESELNASLAELKGSVDEMKRLIVRDFGSEEKFMNDQKAKTKKDSQYLAIPKKNIDDTLQYAFLLYESGDYENARSYVNILFYVADHIQDLLKLSWGRLCLILCKKFQELKDGTLTKDNVIVDELKSLRNRLENRGPESYFHVISGKCSLLHYTIMSSYIFSSEPDYHYLIEIFSSDSFMSSIQTCATHLFRYLIFMLILSKNKKKAAKYNLGNVTNSYENNLCTYKDESVRFVCELYVNFDFEQANECLKTFKAEVSKDIFLAGYEETMKNNAQELLFESFCNIYSSVDIDLISKY